MRLRTAVIASALAGLFYATVPVASALPAPSRADVTTPAAKSAIEHVHRRRGWRRGWRHRHYGYRSYGYRPYGYYRPYRYYGSPYYYRRRPGFGIYFGL
jgi:hypothetical protein